MMGEAANKWREFTYIGARNCKNRSKPEEDYGMLGEHDAPDLGYGGRRLQKT